MTNHQPQTVRMHFSIHDNISIDGVDYTPVSSNKEGHVLRRFATPDLCVHFSHEEIASLWDRGALKRHPDFYAPSKIEGRGPGEIGISTLSEAHQRKIFWKQDWCDQFHELERRGQSTRSEALMLKAIEQIAPKIAGAHILRLDTSQRCGGVVEARVPPKPTTLRRWLRKYESAGFDPIVLHDRYGRSGNRVDRFDPDVRAALVRVAASYGDSRRPTKKMLYEVLRREIDLLNMVRIDKGEEPLATPGRTALSRQISKLNVFQVVAAREGQAKARNKFAAIGLGVSVMRPLERTEMDEWNVQLHTILQQADRWKDLSPKERAAAKRSRIWVSVMTDCATRSVLAVHPIKKSPTASDALATMRMAMLDKSPIALAAGCKSPWPMSGQFTTVVTDTGPAYVADITRAAISDVHAEAMFCPAGVPEMRARIERVFSTIHRQFVSNFDGRTFENVVAKGDYDAEANAVIDPEELYRLLVRYIVDVYHHTPHEGLAGETPFACWQRLTERFGVPMLDREKVGQVFGVSMDRRLRREGIEVFGVIYAHDRVHTLHKKEGARDVKIRFDQTDIGRIFVQIDEEWIRVAAKRDDLDGVSLDDWLNRRSSERQAFAKGAAEMKPIADEAKADITAFADMARQRAQLMPLVYSSDKLRELASVASKFHRDPDISTEDAFFEEYDGDHPDVAPAPVATDDAELAETTVDETNIADFFLED
ncbi:Mu transposase C-terminal domain-containing protein [Aliihoeflea sp. 2WW]|uniref:Mu transposase C-terminal domain-containing protein n=1 Tax=Aliihoeflea sp. 2WW TaxID=1381123 RepID=UPI0004AD33FB|nr:Mu transposase C-terminal domain-containing protein [Aliihoeflea sp. 2WW]